jgi:hypothetical protein
MQYQQPYAQSSSQARQHQPSLHPSPYYPPASSLPPSTPTQPQSGGYYSGPASAPGPPPRQLAVSPRPPLSSGYGYYTPQPGPSTASIPLPSPHQYPLLHPHQRYQNQLAGPPSLAQPPPHTLNIKQEPAPYTPTYPTPARRPSPPRLQVQIHPPTSLPHPPQPPKHGSSGPYTLTANFGALGLDTYATTPFPQPPPSSIPVSPIQPVGTYQPPRPIPKPISIPAAGHPTQYGAVPQSAPPTFPPQFSHNAYTPRYTSRMDSSQQSIASNGAASDRYEQGADMSHTSSAVPSSSHAGDGYPDQGQSSQHQLMQNNPAPAPPMPQRTVNILPTTPNTLLSRLPSPWVRP